MTNLSHADVDRTPLAGRHALVTGGGRGIGAAIGARLAELGAAVSLVGRSQGHVEAQAAALPRACAISADLTEAAGVAGAVEAAVARFGAVDILVNNVGAAESAPFVRTDAALWRRMFGANVDSMFHCTQAVLPGMTARRWGRVVNVVSLAGLKGYAYVTAYCAAKHAAIGLTRALALEIARTGVTVNAICPGYTRTEMLDRSVENIVAKTGCSAEEASAQLRSFNPQDRFIEPAEVAACAAWLCLPGSESVTGQSIAIGGGEVM